jgi:hypothetical protein
MLSMDNIQQVVQRQLLRLPFTTRSEYGEGNVLKTMLELPNNIAMYVSTEHYGNFLANITETSRSHRNLPSPPYIGFRHNGPDVNDFTIYFQRGNSEEITEAVLSSSHDWWYECDCMYDCMCQQKRTIITEYKERQLQPLEILNMLARNPVFLDVITSIWTCYRTSLTLIRYGNEFGMRFFNPSTILDTRQYYTENVCIVCHCPVNLMVIPTSRNRKRRNRFGTLVRCENKYCINIGKQYCNYLKTSIAESCLNIPNDIVRIILQYYTSIDNLRREGDNDLVGDEFMTMARFIIVNM